MKSREDIFIDWITVHKPLLFKVINVYARSEPDKEDLFQEISVQIWKSIPNFKNKSSVHTWIYRIALNTSIKWVRKPSIDNSPLTENEVIITQNQTSDQLTWLYDEISRLSKIDKSITLLMLDGFAYKEIAEMLGISVSNVGVKINRIKQHLKDRSKSK